MSQKHLSVWSLRSIPTGYVCLWLPELPCPAMRCFGIPGMTGILNCGCVPCPAIPMSSIWISRSIITATGCTRRTLLSSLGVFIRNAMAGDALFVCWDCGQMNRCRGTADLSIRNMAIRENVGSPSSSRMCGALLPFMTGLTGMCGSRFPGLAMNIIDSMICIIRRGSRSTRCGWPLRSMITPRMR